MIPYPSTSLVYCVNDCSCYLVYQREQENCDIISSEGEFYLAPPRATVGAAWEPVPHVRQTISSAIPTVAFVMEPDQVVNIANDQRTLKDIEDKILYMLANASGNILDDEELINALSQSKVTSKAINERLTEAEHTTKEINETREDYRYTQRTNSPYGLNP